MKRIFIGLRLPQTILETLNCVQQGLRYAKLVRSENMHLTLRFLGEVNESKLDALDQILRALDFQEFRLSLKGVGIFPMRGPARVMWVGLSPSKELTRLQAIVENKCRALDFEPESRKFYPHITVGRVVKSTEGNIATWLDSFNDLESSTFIIDQYTLFQSILRQSGPIYHSLYDYPLNVNYQIRANIAEDENYE